MLSGDLTFRVSPRTTWSRSSVRPDTVRMLETPHERSNDVHAPLRWVPWDRAAGQWAYPRVLARRLKNCLLLLGYAHEPVDKQFRVVCGAGWVIRLGGAIKSEISGLGGIRVRSVAERPPRWQKIKRFE